MKRRSFLGLLGLAPVVAAVPAVANPTPAPKDVWRDSERIVINAHDFHVINTANIGTVSAGNLRNRDSSITVHLASGTMTWK